MFSMCSELTQRARIPDTRIPQFMQPWAGRRHMHQDRGSGHVRGKCTIRIKDLKKFKAILVSCAFARHQRAKTHTALAQLLDGVQLKKSRAGVKAHLTATLMQHYGGAKKG